MATTETSIVQSGTVVQYVPPNPLAMVASALERGLDAETIAKFMDLAERHEKAEAKRAFTAAKADFKSHNITVTKDRQNKQYNSNYTSLGNLVNTVNPILSKCGLEASWSIDQTAGIKITCTLTHKLGHSESASMVCPPDKSGAKNPIQEIKSAITYGKACTFESVCGLASTDANVDDDGNAAYSGDLNEQTEYIGNCSTLEELQKVFSTYYAEAKKAKSQRAMGALIAAKDARKKELQ